MATRTTVRTITLLAASLAAVSCSDHQPGITGPHEELALAKGSTVTDPTAAFYLPASVGSLGVWGEAVATDNTGLFAGTSRYRNGECGINSKIFATAGASNSGDAIMQTDNRAYTDRKCAYYPRKAWLSYAQPVDPDVAPGPVELQPIIINLNELQNTLVAIPLNAIEHRALNMAPSGGACTGLRWRYHLQDGTVVGADSVWVQRLDARTWHVYTAAGEDKAYCLSDGRLYHMPVDFYVQADRDLPLTIQ